MKLVSHRIESELGSWIHTEWRPETGHPLAWVVERVWDFEGRTTHRRERVFPSGTLELIVQLDERYRDVVGTETRSTPATCVSGIQTGPSVIEAPPQGSRVLGVRLHPQGAWAVLEHPLSELTDVTGDLRDLLGRAAGELADRCDDARDATGRLRRTVAWLLERLDRSSTARHLNPAVRQVAGRIADAGGAARIARLRSEVGLGAGPLATSFLQQIGITPKRYARLHRFQRALEMLQGGSLRLSEVALRAGYYDQPHLNAEFRELAGLTPRQFLAAPRYPASSSTAESP